MLKGVSDSVTLSMRNGTYQVHKVIFSIPGSSTAHPVIITSESGNRDDVVLYYTASGIADNYVLYLQGADFIRLRRLSFRSST